MAGKMRFEEILGISQWQSIQDHFANVLGVPLVTFDKNAKAILAPSTPFTVHTQITAVLSQLAVREEFCGWRLFSHAERSWKDGVRCAGLYYFCIPIQIENDTVAYLSAGPVIIGKRPSEEERIRIAYALAVSSKTLDEVLRQFKSFTFTGIKAMIEFLRDISFYTAHLGYHNRRLKKIAPEVLKMFDKIYRFYVDRLLNALLDISFHFTSTDKGSLMFFDSRKKELYIKRAQGLSQEIIKGTRLKLGEGVAGLAAQNREPFFIGHDACPEPVRERLHEPRLQYSYVIPIEAGQRLIGVLNVSSEKEASSRVPQKDLSSLNALAKLIQTTLKDIPRTFLQ